MKKQLNLSRHALGAVLHDAAMAGLSFILAVYLRLGDDRLSSAEPYLLPGTLMMMGISAVVFFYMRLHRGVWRHASMKDMTIIVKAVTLSVLFFALAMFVGFRLESVPRSVLFINWMLLLVMLGGSRFATRAFCDRTLKRQPLHAQTQRIPVLLVGAGHLAEQFIRHMERDEHAQYEAVGMIDDDRRKRGRTIHRIPIYGSIDMLPAILHKLERKDKRPQKILLTDDRMDSAIVHKLLEAADGLNIPLARLPRLSEFKPGHADRPEIKPIAVEDLLGRPQHALDRDSMRRFVEGRRVLITGAGGTIGSELSRQIASHRPSELVLLELGEFNLYQIEREIRETYPQLTLSMVLCDVRNAAHVDSVFHAHRPEIVFHAAAIKHVPIAEVNIEEAVLTNVFGTRNVAQACLAGGVEAMVMISTDKAINPTSVMGATKRLAESFCQALGEVERGRSATKFITVRFGNVLGSTGSVVPLFQEQLAKGGPITVTHPDMTRYFMTVREAVELVLQAAVLGISMKGQQECVFVLDMGRPMRILDLAAQMIRLAGLRPHEDIKIVFTGLRPGEKLYEELFHFSEQAAKTAHASIFLASPRFANLATLQQALALLLTACHERRTLDALSMLKRLVPEFQSLHPTSSIQELMTA